MTLPFAPCPACGEADCVIWAGISEWRRHMNASRPASRTAAPRRPRPSPSATVVRGRPPEASEGPSR
jgi:hypothetical protein